MPDQIALKRWRTPASEYPRTSRGRASVRTSPYSPGTYHCYMQRGYTYYVAERRLYVTSLEIDGDIWMVDDPPHWWAMEKHATYYHGHVVCAGLGLGLIVHTLTANPEVDRITVVERERDVIGLIGPQLPQEKLTIVEADFHEIGADHFGGVDGVFYDLFVGKGRDLFAEAVATMGALIGTWGRSCPIRIHGFPQELLRGLAATL